MTNATTSRLLLAIVLLVFTCAAAPASAQNAEKEAQQYFEKGAAFYFEGKYGPALVQFRRGHETLPNALFLYNIALCNLKLERYQEALNNAREAKRMGGLGERESALNEARLAAIPRIQDAMSIASDIEQALAAQVSKAEQAPPEAIVDTNAPPPSESSFGALGWIGVATSVAGAGLLTGALVSELSLQNKWEEFEAAAAAQDTTRHAELKEEIERGQRTGKILLYSGAGVTALGITFIVVDLFTSPSDQREIGLFISPDGELGAAASFRF